MPTNAERLVHGMGDGTALLARATPFGPIGGLICGEHGNPLVKFAHAAQGVRLHAGAWPAKAKAGFASSLENMLARVQSCAMEVGHVGVHAAGVFTDQMADAMELSDDIRATLLPGGGSCVVAPNGEIVAGPAGPGETILYADVDLGDIVAAKQRQDFAGHYNRFDLFQVSLNVEAQVPLRLVQEAQPSARTQAPLDGSDSTGPLMRALGTHHDKGAALGSDNS